MLPAVTAKQCTMASAVTATLCYAEDCSTYMYSAHTTCKVPAANWQDCHAVNPGGEARWFQTAQLLATQACPTLK